MSNLQGKHKVKKMSSLDESGVKCGSKRRRKAAAAETVSADTPAPPPGDGSITKINFDEDISISGTMDIKVEPGLMDEDPSDDAVLVGPSTANIDASGLKEEMVYYSEVKTEVQDDPLMVDGSASVQHEVPLTVPQKPCDEGFMPAHSHSLPRVGSLAVADFLTAARRHHERETLLAVTKQSPVPEERLSEQKPMMKSAVPSLIQSSSDNAPSPAKSAKCSGSGCSRSLKPLPQTTRYEDIMDKTMNPGSENESEDEGSSFTLRVLRKYYDDDDDDAENPPDSERSQLQTTDFKEDDQPHAASPIVSNPSPDRQDKSNGSPQLGPTNLFSFDWRPLPNPPIPPEIRREAFVEEAGPTIAASDPYEAFIAIWTPSIIQHIAAETNKYAQQIHIQQVRGRTLKDHSRLTLWSDIDADDIMMFLAVLMSMSIVQRNVITDYWSKDSNILSTPYFSAYMSRNKFQRIFRCLHFNDNSLQSPDISSAGAKIYKLEPITRHLNEAFKRVYRVGRNISLEESLTQRKGLPINRCVPNKAAKLGIQSYEVCDSKTGYLHRFEIHAKGVEAQEPVSDSPISGFVPRLVLRLLNGLEHRGRTVWLDKVYNSPALARVLKTKGFDCVGTLNTTCALVPAQLHQIKSGHLPLRTGAVVGCTSGDVDLFVWHDTSRVAFLSTYHGMAVYHCPVENKKKPTLLRDYNVTMGGLDKKDQILSAYPIERAKLMAWYKKLFLRLLSVSILNASLVFNASPDRRDQMSQKQFRRMLVLAMLERHGKRTLALDPLVEKRTRHVPHFALAHFTVPYEMREGRNERLRRSCVVCHTRVRTHCPACEVALCLTPCAQHYHSKK